MFGLVFVSLTGTQVIAVRIRDHTDVAPGSEPSPDDLRYKLATEKGFIGMVPGRLLHALPDSEVDHDTLRRDSLKWGSREVTHEVLAGIDKPSHCTKNCSCMNCKCVKDQRDCSRKCHGDADCPRKIREREHKRSRPVRAHRRTLTGT
jgi:hypothetical protein